MKLALMQPYFFPYLGYFDLINVTDKFIVFDTVQYIERGWVNRNRVLEVNKKWQFVRVPLKKHPRDIKINEVRISDTQPWTEQFFAQISCYRNKAPHYLSVMQLLEESLSFDTPFLSEFNVHCMKSICDFLEIQLDIEFFSKMDLDLEVVNKPGDWALNISSALGADGYVNLPGGEAIYNPDDFQNKGIDLMLRSIPVFNYKTIPFDFVPNLSIIDVLMWNSPEQVKSYLDALKNKEFNLIENEKS